VGNVPSIIDLMPVMFIEGAVQGPEALESAGSNEANRLTVRFNQGEKLCVPGVAPPGLVYRHIGHPERLRYSGGGADPPGPEPHAVRLKHRSEYYVERNDVLIIPFRQYFVTAAGSVAKPDRYPYIPDRSWDYYVALAGGFVKERNSRDAVVIKDIAGKTLRKTDPILPETVITARTNAGLYFFNQYAPVITTLLSLVTTFISVTMLVSR
jgi:hypothetical protein